MAVIAIYSVKGGVGKTTLAANLAWCSATVSERATLLWDLDPSGGAGFLLGAEPSGTRPVARIFSSDRVPAELVAATPYPRLSLLGADESVRTLDERLGRVGYRNRLSRMADTLERDFDRIILDCPPVMNELSTQILRVADVIIVPLPPSPLSTRSFEQISRAAKASGRKHPPILPVLNMLDMRRRLHVEAREAASDWPAIPFASAIEQCAVRQKPIGAFAPSAPAAKSIVKLWTAIERKLIGG